MGQSEQKAFLFFLSSVCGTATLPVELEEVDPSDLFQLAEEHSLAAVLYKPCRQQIGELQGAGKFKKAFLGAVFSSTNRRELLREILSRFAEAKIPVIFMKGAVVRDYYPVPELREMGDVDFIIRPEDRAKSDEIMRSLGYNRIVDNHAVWTYWIRDFMFEIHDHMFYEELVRKVDYRAYFDHVWENAKPGQVFGLSSDYLFVPEERFHLLYLMAHTAKHVINNGNGFRAYLDMVMMALACGEALSWDWIAKELDKLELLGFARTCFALCERWFDVKMPELPAMEMNTAQIKADSSAGTSGEYSESKPGKHGVTKPGKHNVGRQGENSVDSPEEENKNRSEEGDTLDEAFFQAVTEKTFRDGIFGLENEQNIATHSAKELERSDKPYYATAFALTWKKIFPPYRDMQLIPWYRFVDGKPWLMPAAWVYRWLYVLAHKARAGVALMVEPFSKRKEIEARKAYLRDWGL